MERKRSGIRKYSVDELGIRYLSQHHAPVPSGYRSVYSEHSSRYLGSGRSFDLPSVIITTPMMNIGLPKRMAWAEVQFRNKYLDIRELTHIGVHGANQKYPHQQSHHILELGINNQKKISDFTPAIIHPSIHPSTHPSQHVHSGAFNHDVQLGSNWLQDVYSLFYMWYNRDSFLNCVTSKLSKMINII
jgi:hypothetical protein